MELSQTALAMLLVGGFPAGAALNLAYTLTDIGGLPEGIGKTLLGQIKDFLFMLTAALMAVLMVYYVNSGEFRYLTPVGMIGGYAICSVTLGRIVLRIRNVVLHVLAIPLKLVWSATVGRLCQRARYRAVERLTEKHVLLLMQLASNGFEN